MVKILRKICLLVLYFVLWIICEFSLLNVIENTTKTWPIPDLDTTETRPKYDQNMTRTRPIHDQDTAKTRPSFVGFYKVATLTQQAQDTTKTWPRHEQDTTKIRPRDDQDLTKTWPSLVGLYRVTTLTQQAEAMPSNKILKSRSAAIVCLKICDNIWSYRLARPAFREATRTSPQICCAIGITRPMILTFYPIYEDFSVARYDLLKLHFFG